MHRVDLENKDIRVDLISDIDTDCVNTRIIDSKCRIEKITINNKNFKTYNKNKGRYISIFFDYITDYEMKEKIISILSLELKSLLEEKKLSKKPVLVVGLGNLLSTPDSLGPKAIDKIVSTRHIYLLDNLDSNYSIVSKISPGVFANTGIESFDIIKGIIYKIKPDYVIIIDSLSSKSLNKVNKVIQITDSGIDPGSGVGNHRKEISKKTLKIPVIAIGVPTVVSLHTIIKDTLNEYELDNVLSKKSNNYFVTPKEIDFIIEQLSYIISKSINNVLHNTTK